MMSCKDEGNAFIDYLARAIGHQCDVISEQPFTWLVRSASSTPLGRLAAEASFVRGGPTVNDIRGTGPFDLGVGPAGVGGPSRSPSAGAGRPAGMAEAPPPKAEII